MKATVWVVSAVLALAFLVIGGMKVIGSAADLAQASPGVPVALLRVAGTAEVLGALGLILPAVTRIAPVLTPLAASGLVAVMVGATVTNIVVGLYSAVAVTVVLGLLAGFVAWARFTRQAVQPRVGGSALDEVA